MQSKRVLLVLKLFIMMLFFSIFLIVIVVTILLLIIGLNKRKSKHQDDSSGYKEKRFFKYFQVDSLNNRTFRGVFTVIVPEIASAKKEYFHHESEISNVKTTLISNFGENEYVCTGSCVCFEEKKDSEFALVEDRRSSSSSYLLTKGVLYLVSAVTSLVAINLAKVYFSDECKKRLSDICEFSKIVSEVDSCQNLEILDSGSEEDPQIDTTKYICSGRCEKAFLFDQLIGEEGEKSLREYMEEVTLELTLNPKYETIWKDVYENDALYSQKDNSNKGSVRIFNKKGFAKDTVFELFRSLSLDCIEFELTSTVEVERVGSFEYQELEAINKFFAVNLFKFCKMNGMIDFNDESVAKRVVKRLEERRLERIEKFKRMGGKASTRLLPYFLKLVEAVVEYTKQYDVWKVCTAKKASRVNEMNVVCLRQFTDEEWRLGIPYEHNNLRHWKTKLYNTETDR